MKEAEDDAIILHPELALHRAAEERFLRDRRAEGEHEDLDDAEAGPDARLEGVPRASEAAQEEDPPRPRRGDQRQRDRERESSADPDEHGVDSRLRRRGEPAPA